MVVDKYWQCDICDSTYAQYPENGYCSYCGNDNLWELDLEDYEVSSNT